MRIRTVINPESKTGVGKNNKVWTQAQVELEDGTRTYMFQPVAEGDEVESFENNGYTNWRKVKPISQESQTIINMLIDCNKKLDQLLGLGELDLP